LAFSSYIVEAPTTPTELRGVWGSNLSFLPLPLHPRPDNRICIHCASRGLGAPLSPLLLIDEEKSPFHSKKMMAARKFGDQAFRAFWLKQLAEQKLLPPKVIARLSGT
jgi:hypothetical protein